MTGWRDNRVYNARRKREGCETVASDNPKLLSLSEAQAWRVAQRDAGRKVVLTNGVFDLLHPGHRHYLQKARALGDALIVALNSDASVKALKGPARPIQGEAERAAELAKLDYVDAIVVFRQPRLVPEIEALRPDVYSKAGDYTLEKLDPGERAALETVGARIEFMPFLPGHSTTQIIEERKQKERG
jgi:D-glycero-beta-D-manno-heptose 1-phosphate adenylyltransferase